MALNKKTDHEGRLSLIGLIQLSVSQSGNLSNSSVSKELLADLIQTCGKNLNNSVTLHLGYTTNFGSGIHMNRSGSESVAFTGRGSDVGRTSRCIDTVDLGDK